MAKPIDLEVVRSERKEHCPFCGDEEHKVPLLCPRISGVTLSDDGSVVEIHFWPDDGDCPLAG